MTILNFDQGTDSVTIIDGDNTVTDDDVINEIDENLIDADSEIDIGEMIWLLDVNFLIMDIKKIGEKHAKYKEEEKNDAGDKPCNDTTAT